MRKFQSPLLAALVMFQISCEPVNQDPPAHHPAPRLEQVHYDFHQLFVGVFNRLESQPVITTLDRSAGQLMVKVETDSILKAAREYFIDHLYTGTSVAGDLLTVTPPLLPAFKIDWPVTSLENIIDSLTSFNVPQKAYIKSLAKGAYNVANVEEGISMVSALRNQIIQADELGKDEKLILLEIAAGSTALLEFIKHGGVDYLSQKLAGELATGLSNGRISGCSVDWRGVWMGGIVSAAVGATVGFYAGATVGTFAVPVVGTVTGAVNGAVVGGALGFTTSVLEGIAADLLSSCFRSGNIVVQQTFSSCEQAWEAYLSGRIGTIPSNCFVVEIPI